MAEGSLSRVISLVDTWSTRKGSIAKVGTTKSLNEFVGTMNALTGQMMSELGRAGQNDTEFYESLQELAQNAAARINNAKIFVNGKDITNS